MVKQLGFQVTQSAADTLTFTWRRNPMFGQGGIRPLYVRGGWTPSELIAWNTPDWGRWTLFNDSDNTPSALPSSASGLVIASMDLVMSIPGNFLNPSNFRISDFLEDEIFVEEYIILGVTTVTTGRANIVGLQLGYEDVKLSELELTQALY